MTFPTHFGRCATLLGAVLIAAIGATASANENVQLASDDVAPAAVGNVEDDGASQRVNLSGKLRMLSQRVTTAACYVRAGVAVDETMPALMNASAEYDTILDALEFGDDNLGVFGEETRRRTLVGLGKLRDEYWAPVSEHASIIAAGAGDGETVASMAALSEPLLEFAKRMVVEISGQYSNPAILVQADAMLIDIAGRQRMLSQRVSKNACLLGTGLGDDTTRGQMEGAMGVFENSLLALFNGMPETGVRPPPTDEISDALGAVLARWMSLKPVLQSIDQADAESLAIVYTQTTALTAEMNAIVSMYSEASKQGL